MRPPIPVIAQLGSDAAVLRPYELHADLHRTGVPLHHSQRAVGTVLTRSIVWALIAIAVLVSLRGVAAASTAGTAYAPPSHRPNAAHHQAGTTTPRGSGAQWREPHGTTSPPATASTSQA